MVHYSQDRNGYDFANIVLESGDILHLIYIDSDGDGLGTRLEALSGTFTTISDTKGASSSD